MMMPLSSSKNNNVTSSFSFFWFPWNICLDAGEECSSLVLISDPDQSCSRISYFYIRLIFFFSLPFFFLIIWDMLSSSFFINGKKKSFNKCNSLLVVVVLIIYINQSSYKESNGNQTEKEPNRKDSRRRTNKLCLCGEREEMRSAEDKRGRNERASWLLSFLLIIDMFSIRCLVLWPRMSRHAHRFLSSFMFYFDLAAR